MPGLIRISSSYFRGTINSRREFEVCFKQKGDVKLDVMYTLLKVPILLFLLQREDPKGRLDQPTTFPNSEDVVDVSTSQRW